MHHFMEPSLSQDVILPHSLLHGLTTDMCGSMQLHNCSIKNNTCSCFNVKPKRKCLSSITRNKNLVLHHDGATSTTYLIEYLFDGFFNETNYGCIHKLCIFKLRMIAFFFKSHKNVHIPKMKFHAGN
jgi:hypothetical protein